MGLLSAVPTLASAAAAFNPDTVCISILHTTDLHGHILPSFDYDGNPDRGGLARCATQIRRWQRGNPNSILIDVGDVYQGTDVSLRNKGALMIDLLNHLEYDAWVVGNHEFDWGMECFERALQQSNMPVLAANMLMQGKLPGEFPDAKHPFSKVQPFILKEIAGIKIAIIGITTPGMPFWLWPDFTRGLDFRHPVEPVRRAIASAKSGGADAIVLTGHMGLKTRSGGDDFANTVMALTSEFPEVAVFIAGHTHQDVPSRLTNGVLFTQADHFGIHVGRVDLLFDRNSKKLLHREAICDLMDSRFSFDQMVLSRAKSHLAESSAALSEPIGELAETLRGRSRPSRPSDVERLIGAAIMEMLMDRNVSVDGVMHGTFDDKADLIAGPKTVYDVWNIIPFENYIVTAQLSPEEIKIAMEDVFASHEKRNLLGFELKTEGLRDDCKIVSMVRANREPLDRNKKYVIAFNSFDARSGGHHFMKLRAFLDRPEGNCILHPVQTRDALIGYFQRHKVVHRMAGVTPLAIAA
ncbi:MAG TPA: bifunctional UDP-sugar hydrolase/5'-nucleotidase [Candidatus Dormibacteraeota bacterium]|jgi:2',3'-cyclic-nucleotide 2'-phosphodiesterase/3'-nucleotidase|nr:bifunctional UDP-sugar hydrolase/5'-nucleotidase [Candidatus Dormibacteraeota bacterium]